MDKDKYEETTEESGDEEISEIEPSSSKEVGRTPFSKVTREMNDEALSNPDVGRMLLGEKDRLQQEKAVLESYRENYHKEKTRAEVCEAKDIIKTKGQKLYTVVQALGGIILGASLSVEGDQFWIFFIIGGILVLGSIIINFAKKS